MSCRRATHLSAGLRTPPRVAPAREAGGGRERVFSWSSQGTHVQGSLHAPPSAPYRRLRRRSRPRRCRRRPAADRDRVGSDLGIRHPLGDVRVALRRRAVPVAHERGGEGPDRPRSHRSGRCRGGRDHRPLPRRHLARRLDAGDTADQDHQHRPDRGRTVRHHPRVRALRDPRP
ncbi:hypothetical protein CURTO8I2_140106 [Curtobacterium sp. 8I-2]|nr:hypothetical protein CURTO8I2_140106 [Curtobacterium sp. 8I-2]